MKRTLRITTILLCNLILLALLVEAVGLVVFYRAEGTLFYTRPTEMAPAEMEDPGDQVWSEYRFQPYWGFSTKPNRKRVKGKYTNNYGFRFEVDYPLARQDHRQVIIGVFGGSVGAQFTVFGGDRFKEVLSADQRFAGRDLVLLNFAGGGYKQPQQLQILAYFLSQGQHFDLVLNIDGFNEVALSPFNRGSGIALAMPSSLHMLPLINLLDHSTLTTERLLSLYRIHRLKDRQRAVSVRLQDTHSAGLHLVLNVWNKNLQARYSWEVNRFQSLETDGTATSLMGIAALEKQVTDPDTMFECLSTGWAESSLLMHQLLSARGIPYLHFLQPNQYFTERVFTVDQAAVAIRKDSPVRGNATRGYSDLKAKGSWLVSQGVPFHDATGIFDDEPAAVYEDNCCHYNQLGNEMLAEFIARRVLENL